MELGLRLKRDGYEPFYILAPHERDRWACLAEAGLQIQQAPSLADVAAFIHECGWFIGNESGVGHLASSVGVPTLTLTGRPTNQGMATGLVLVAYRLSAYIPGGRWRDRFWRDWLWPGSVMAAFGRLAREYEGSAASSKDSISNKPGLRA